MSTPVCYLGVDVAKDTLVLPEGYSIRCVPNSPEGFARLRALLSTLANPIVICEASGPYHLALALDLQAHHFAVAIVNPRAVRNFSKAHNKVAKTDPLDAKLLSLFGQSLQITPSAPLDPKQLELASLVSRREELVFRHGQLKAKLLLSTCSFLKSSLKAELCFLANSIKKLEKYLSELLAQSPLWSSKFKTLTSVKGVGKVLALTLLAHMPELGSLSKNQVASLAGVAPFDHQSGFWRAKSRISGGRANVRKALYMAALVGSRFNPVLNSFYNRLILNRKPKKLALTALMRKLIIHLNSLLKSPLPPLPSSL